MHCSDFLNRYSDFRDGEITDLGTLREMQEHLRICSRCRRYEHAIRHGIGILRTLGQIEPSAAFQRELRVRLAQAALRVDRRPRLTPAGVAAAVLVAVAGALLLYEGLTAGRRVEEAAVARPIPIVIANPSVPFVSFTASDSGGQAGIVVPASLSRPTGEWGTIAP
jgi:predicted anti-sigma-YlaC factor YlaD